MSLMLKDILRIAEKRFSRAGCLDPRNDAELLFCHMVNRDKSWLFLHYGDELNDKECEEYFSLVDRRADGTPLQYITGNQEFMGLDFYVNKKVLIPRQDTEILVEKALRLIKDREILARNYRILDLCCGSGAIAVSMAYYLKESKTKFSVTASDISADAIKVAKANAIYNNVEKNITFIEGDLFTPFPKNRKGRGKEQFSLIISNPPYIPTKVIPTLMREVKDHEPLLALDGGAEGVDFYIRILSEAYLFLEKNGVILLEIGHDQGEILPILAQAAGAYCSTEIIKDLSGNNRLAIIRRDETICAKRSK